MLPAHLHIEVARDCVQELGHRFLATRCKKRRSCKENNLIFMNEIGLDPGVDHMSAMKVIDEISDKGGKMLLFESFVLLHQSQIQIVGIINSLGLPVM
jgi:hypothetical protein